jgi:hypothetical protein
VADGLFEGLGGEAVVEVGVCVVEGDAALEEGQGRELGFEVGQEGFDEVDGVGSLGRGAVHGR